MSANIIENKKPPTLEQFLLDRWETPRLSAIRAATAAFADFFNSIGNVKETLAENGSGRRDVEVRFPFGGYWQAMREATTADEMRRLQAVAIDGLGSDSPHIKNANTFKLWYQYSPGA